MEMYELSYGKIGELRKFFGLSFERIFIVNIVIVSFASHFPFSIITSADTKICQPIQATLDRIYDGLQLLLPFNRFLLPFETLNIETPGNEVNDDMPFKIYGKVIFAILNHLISGITNSRTNIYGVRVIEDSPYLLNSICPLSLLLIRNIDEIFSLYFSNPAEVIKLSLSFWLEALNPFNTVVSVDSIRHILF